MAMTEQEWLASSDPRAMVEFLRDKASDRKLRLSLCACCRQEWHHFRDERSRLAIRTAERFAEGEATEDERRTALDQAVEAKWELCRQHDFVNAAYAQMAEDAVRELAQRYPSYVEARILRDVFGPLPLHAVTLKPAWRTSNVTALAQSIYDDRAFDRLPILADALEDAGCDNADILNHCRSGGEHVRGCWAVDLVLEKE
jgi:hypothetical protein